MSSRIWLINFVLAVVVIFFGIRAYGVWSEGEKGFSEIRAIKRPLSQTEKRITKRSMPPESDYEVIVGNNLFWVDRSEYIQGKQETKSAAKPKVDKKLLMRLEAALRRIVVYGVIIADGLGRALISNPNLQTGRKTMIPGPGGRSTRLTKTGQKPGPSPLLTQPPKRRTKWIKVGDTLGEFKVNDIREGSVLLTAAGNEYQIFLYDKEKPKKRIPVKRKERPTVVSLGTKTKGGPEVVKTTPKKEIPRPKVSKKKQPPKRIVKARKSPSNKIKPGTRQR